MRAPRKHCLVRNRGLSREGDLHKPRSRDLRANLNGALAVSTRLTLAASRHPELGLHHNLVLGRAHESPSRRPSQRFVPAQRTRAGMRQAGPVIDRPSPPNKSVTRTTMRRTTLRPPFNLFRRSFSRRNLRPKRPPSCRLVVNRCRRQSRRPVRLLACLRQLHSPSHRDLNAPHRRRVPLHRVAKRRW